MLKFLCVEKFFCYASLYEPYILHRYEIYRLRHTISNDDVQ